MMNRRPLLILLAILGAMTAARTLVAWKTDLSPDEAYYFAWALKPAAGYLDHPPLVAWLIHAATAAFGNAELAVRSPAIVCGLLMPVVLYFIAIEAGATATWALVGAAIAVLTPLASAGAVIITPDTPMGLFWAASVLMLVRLVRRGGEMPAAALAIEAVTAGIFIGLTMLSKYSGALLLCSALAYVPFAKDRRRAAIWLVAVPAASALVVYLPNLLYNLGGKFASMSFQWTHVWGESGKESFRLFEFLGGQIGVAGPFCFAGMIVIVRRFFMREVDGRLRLLQLATLLPFCIPLLVSIFNKVEPNWPAPAWITAVPLLAATFGAGEAVTKRVKTTALLALAYGVIVTALIHVHAIVPFLPIPLDKDPAAQQLHGWRAITHEVEKTIVQVPDAKSRLPTTFSYRIAAELYYYSEGRLQSLCLDRRFYKGDDMPLAGAERWIAIEQFPAKKADAAMKLMCKNGYQRHGALASLRADPLRRLDLFWCD